MRFSLLQSTPNEMYVFNPFIFSSIRLLDDLPYSTAIIQMPLYVDVNDQSEHNRQTTNIDCTFTDMHCNVSINKYITIEDYEDLTASSGTTPLPFSASIKFSLLSYNNNGSILMGKTGGQYYNSEFYVVVDSSSISFYLFQSSGANTIYAIAYFNFKLNTEYEIVVTSNGVSLEQGLRIYIDKKEIKTTKAKTGTYTYTANTTNKIALASALWPGGYTNYLNGYIKEFYYWNYEL